MTKIWRAPIHPGSLPGVRLLCLALQASNAPFSTAGSFDLKVSWPEMPAGHQGIRLTILAGCWCHWRQSHQGEQYLHDLPDWQQLHEVHVLHS